MNDEALYYAKMSSKGQVTIPIKVRDVLKINQNDTIRFQLTPNGEFLISRYEQTKLCHHDSPDEVCVLCLNSGVIDFSKSLFEHLKSIELNYERIILLQIKEHGVYYFSCHEHPLSDDEQEILLKWFEYQERRR